MVAAPHVVLVAVAVLCVLRDAAATSARPWRQPLTSWTLTNANGSLHCAAQVPGQLQLDLLRAGLLPQPLERFNDVAAQWPAASEPFWTYTTNVSLPAPATSSSSSLATNPGSSLPTPPSHVFLNVSGCDTICEIRVNDQLVLSSTNQFRSYIINITDAITIANSPSTTTIDINLSVRIASPVQYASAAAAAYPYPVPHASFQNGLPDFNFIRKAPSSFGWDWGLALAPSGIWRPLSLVSAATAASPLLEDVTPVMRFDRAAGAFRLEVTAVLIVDPGIPAAATRVTVQVRNPATNTVIAAGSASADPSATPPARPPAPPATPASAAAFQAFRLSVRVTLTVADAAVERWWPHGQGAQPLYILGTRCAAAAPEDEWVQEIGFREIAVVEQPLPSGEQGLSFWVLVNNRRVFLKGASFVPADALDAAADDTRYERLVASAVLANHNAIRIWGGGDTAPEALWRACDRAGLLVWLDFPFASSLLPRNAAFVADVVAETQDILRRVAWHPSLALLCGSNEAVKTASLFAKTNTSAALLYMVDVAALFDAGVRQAAYSVLGDAVFFFASSPSNGFAVDRPEEGLVIHRFVGDPFSPLYGDVRHYDYSDNILDTSTYPTGRIVSEYGWQAHPSLYAYANVTQPADRHWNSSLMQWRQHHPSGNQQMLQQMARFFPPPADTLAAFADFVFLSQVVQALSTTTQSQFYRSLKNAPGAYTGGALYWQLNDIWQAPTWSSIEYGPDTRWKPLHYTVARAFAPLAVFGFLVANGTRILVHVNNDQPVPLENAAVTADVWCWDHPAAAVARHPVSGVSVPALGDVLVLNASAQQLIGPGHTPAQCSLKLTLSAANGSRLAYSDLFLGGRIETLARANITVDYPPIVANAGLGNGPTNTITFRVTSSDNIAPWCWLHTPLSGYFSDNAFTLLPGVENAATITFTAWPGLTFTAAEFKTALQVDWLGNHLSSSSVQTLK